MLMTNTGGKSTLYTLIFAVKIYVYSVLTLKTYMHWRLTQRSQTPQ